MAGSKVTKFKQWKPTFDIAKCSVCLVWTSRPVTDHCHTHGWVRHLPATRPRIRSPRERRQRVSTIGLRVFLAALPLAILAFWHVTGMLRRSSWPPLAFQAAWWAGTAAIQIWAHQPWYAFPAGIAAAVFGHAAWEVWRRGRKPRSERATGRVVDLGHRLGVVTESKP